MHSGQISLYLPSLCWRTGRALFCFKGIEIDQFNRFRGWLRLLLSRSKLSANDGQVLPVRNSNIREGVNIVISHNAG